MTDKHTVKDLQGFVLKSLDESLVENIGLPLGALHGCLYAYRYIKIADVKNEQLAEADRVCLELVHQISDSDRVNLPVVTGALGDDVPLYHLGLTFGKQSDHPIRVRSISQAASISTTNTWVPLVSGNWVPPVEASAVADVLKAQRAIADMIADTNRRNDIAVQEAKDAKAERRRRVVGMWADIKQDSVEIQKELRKDWA
jgi:hypothetical protein